MINQQSIPCPDCQTSIFFDPQMLLKGMQFACPNCHASLGLASESKEIVEQSLDKFNKLKSDILKMKEDQTKL